MTCSRYEIKQRETGVCTVQFLNHCNITNSHQLSPAKRDENTNGAIKCPQITSRVAIWQRIYQHKLSLLFQTRATAATNTGTGSGISNSVNVTASETPHAAAHASRFTKYVCVLCLHQAVRNSKHRAIRYYSNISVPSSDSHISVLCCTQSHGPQQSVTYSHQVARYELWGVLCLERDRDISHAAPHGTSLRMPI